MCSAEECGFHEQDRNFVALADGNFADAAARSDRHLLCRAGCSSCCIGAFAVGPADSLRIQHGLEDLQQSDPERVSRIHSRAAASWDRLQPGFPGDCATGQLTVDQDGEPSAEFADFANHESCPALDPTQGTCDLYAWRPHTCRVFGPPVATPEGYGVCELCFRDASPLQISAAAIAPEPEGMAQALDRSAVAAGAQPGPTILAFLLRPAR